jgi:septal ring factor EnvC (AmiA/AmiB activator)
MDSTQQLKCLDEQLDTAHTLQVKLGDELARLLHTLGQVRSDMAQVETLLNTTQEGRAALLARMDASSDGYAELKGRCTDAYGDID